MDAELDDGMDSDGIDDEVLGIDADMMDRLSYYYLWWIKQKKKEVEIEIE